MAAGPRRQPGLCIENALVYVGDRTVDRAANSLVSVVTELSKLSL